MSLPLWQAAGLALVAGAAGFRQFQGWLYLFQLDEYLPSRLRSTASRRLAANWPWQLALLLLAAALAVVAAAIGRQFRPLPLLAACLLPLPLFRPFAVRAALKWTRRARRLAAVAGALVLLALWLVLWTGAAGAVLVGLLDPLVALALTLAALASGPYEASLRRRFMASAEARLAVSDPLVVGITGSYGKTTTKVILGQLLDSAEQPCFITPESYNTTLGVCRALNEGLLPHHRVAVVEMGAYRPGEIAEICSFTHPKVGVVTALGLMHLERFGTRAEIARAKSELLAALPEDGLAVIPSDIAERETLLFGLRARLLLVGAPGDRWWVEGERLLPTGTALLLRGSGGEEAGLEVPVYGRHLLSDLLCAVAVAFELGRPLAEIAARAASIKGAPHRLEVTRQAGITIIDDAYNANPTGAAEALRLLAALPGERRVLVTPGYIELGSEQERSMRELGRMAAGVCTHVILVGPRHSAPVAAGLQEAGYPKSQVSVVADLLEAQRILPRVAGGGSVVLFENDLPDQYLERS